AARARGVDRRELLSRHGHQLSRTPASGRHSGGRGPPGAGSRLDVSAARASRRLITPLPPTGGPVEGEELHAVAGRLGRPRLEEGVVPWRNVAEHPDARTPHALAGAVEPLDLEQHPGGSHIRLVVDVALDHGTPGALRHLPLDPEVPLKTLCRIDLRPRPT